MRNVKRIIAVFSVFVILISIIPNVLFVDANTNNHLKFIAVSSHAGTTMAITESGDLYMWGKNDIGYAVTGEFLGYYGTFYATESIYIPVKIGENVKDVSVGNQHYAYIDNAGTLWASGWNDYGQIGDGTTNRRLTPVRIMDNATQVSAGTYHTAVIKTDGSLWAWGYGADGRVGDGTTTEKNTRPVKIMDDVIQVSAGNHHTLALKRDGSLWAWGDNRLGQLGDGTNSQNLSPIKIMDGVVSISAENHSLAVTRDGSLWAWGRNEYGVLGNGTTKNENAPVKIMDNVKYASVGEWHTAVIKTDGSLWTWGGNFYGQLGDGTETGMDGNNVRTDNNRLSPVKIMDNVKFAHAGTSQTNAITNDGRIFGWGRNEGGQAAAHTTQMRINPVMVMDNVKSIAAGDDFTLLVKNDNTLWVSGYAFDSNLFVKITDGLGTAPDIAGATYTGSTGTSQGRFFRYMRNNPNIGFGKLMDGVSQVETGSREVFILKTDSTLWYQTEMIHAVPTPIKIMDNVRTIKRENFSVTDNVYAIKNDGSLWKFDYVNTTSSLDEIRNILYNSRKLESINDADSFRIGWGNGWGTWVYGSDGNLWAVNTGNTANEHSYSLENVPYILAMEYYDRFYQLKHDNTLWQTGTRNALGRHETLETSVKIIDNIEKICNFHPNSGMFILLKDKSLWGWGKNEYGQLGTGDTIDLLSPIKLMDNVKDVQSGRSHTVVLTEDGKVWTFGLNDKGQLGINHQRLNQLTPADIFKDLGYLTNPPDISSDNTFVSEIHKPSEWAADTVKIMKDKGIFREADWTNSNHTQNIYTQPLTRAQAVKLMMATWKSAGGYKPRVNVTPFSDIIRLPFDLRDDIDMAYNLKLVAGTSNNSFSPDNIYDRETAAVLAVRMFEKLTGRNDSDWSLSFSDRNSISSWAAESVGKVVKYGLMQGTGNGFSPKDPLTLEQGLTMFLNLLRALENNRPLRTSDPDWAILEQYANEVIRLTNIERQKLGLRELQHGGSILAEVATIRAEELIARYSHTRPDGREFHTILQQYEITDYAIDWGENISMRRLTPEEVVAAWMDSPGHRDNILTANFTHLCVGVARDTSGDLYWVQVFIERH